MKNFITKTIQEAGEYLMDHFWHLDPKTISHKSKRELVTPVDLAVDKMLVQAIQKEYPDHDVISEEAGLTRGHSQEKAEYVWFIDPLDGTTNYSMHNPLFASTIGLAHKDKVILSVTYAPFLKELYVAEKDKGAFLNGEPIKVSTEGSIDKALLTFCQGYMDRDVARVIEVYRQFKNHALDARQLGSASIELAWVAVGRTESISIPGLHPWDVAAGALLVSEAGGQVTDFEGKEWTLNTNDIVASNGHLHQEILKLIKLAAKS